MALTIIEAARLMWCPGLAQLARQPRGNIQHWLATATFAPAVAKGKIILSGINEQVSLEALGSDVNRIASAASETLKNITEINALSKSLAWPYVKLYYAALYYAHSMLRIWGRSPSYFRTLELIKLRDILSTYGITQPYKLQTGQYLLTFNMADSAVNLEADNGGGGAHEFLWRELHRALADLRASVLSGPYLAADSRKVCGQIDSLSALISRNGQNVAWPSQMRNDIQYRQAEGVWYPYQGRAKTSSLAHDVANIMAGDMDILQFMSNSGNDLARFRSSCLAIICFVRNVISDMSAIGGPKSFLRFGQRKFEDAIAI